MFRCRYFRFLRFCLYITQYSPNLTHLLIYLSFSLDSIASSHSFLYTTHNLSKSNPQFFIPNRNLPISTLGSAAYLGLEEENPNNSRVAVASAGAAGDAKRVVWQDVQSVPNYGLADVAMAVRGSEEKEREVEAEKKRAKVVRTRDVQMAKKAAWRRRRRGSRRGLRRRGGRPGRAERRSGGQGECDAGVVREGWGQRVAG